MLNSFINLLPNTVAPSLHGVRDKPSVFGVFYFMEEIFKDIPGWEGFYQASNTAKVKSLARTIVSCSGKVYNRKERILKQSKSSDGYMVVYLSRGGRDYNIGVHRLMGLAFIPNPKNKPMINHLNSIRHDNRLENFEWATNAENIQQSFDQGISSNLGEKHPCAKLTDNDVREIKVLLSGNGNVRDIAAKYMVSRRTIAAIKSGQNWSHI